MQCGSVLSVGVWLSCSYSASVCQITKSGIRIAIEPMYQNGFWQHMFNCALRQVLFFVKQCRVTIMCGKGELEELQLKSKGTCAVCRLRRYSVRGAISSGITEVAQVFPLNDTKNCHQQTNRFTV